MRLLTKVMITRDEEYGAAGRIAGTVETALNALKLDTYNKEYVVRLVVDEVDRDAAEEADSEPADEGGD